MKSGAECIEARRRARLGPTIDSLLDTSVPDANTNKKSVIVVCAGGATGDAVARRFAREGSAACVTRRSADKLVPLVERICAKGGEAHAFAFDAWIEADMQTLISAIERDIAPIDVAVFNISANVGSNVIDTTERVYRKVWEMGFKATGNASPVSVPAKGKWMLNDLKLWGRRYYRALWESQLNLGDPAVLATTLFDAGFNGKAFTALVSDLEVKAQPVGNTEVAVLRGVFDAPAFFLGAQMFFGQDRLDFVRAALA